MRWDPNRENSLFFDQSATLYSTYYHVQILIHRPFIPSRECPCPTFYRDICLTNALYFAARVLDHVNFLAFPRASRVLQLGSRRRSRSLR